MEHVYRLKVAHQAQLDKVEQIYRSNLEEMSDVVDGDVEAAAVNVRESAERALEMIRPETVPYTKKGEHLLSLQKYFVLFSNLKCNLYLYSCWAQVETEMEMVPF